MTLAPDRLQSEAPPSSDFRELIGPFVVFAILIGATIPWRSKTYFEGGTDPVVLAKAALSLLGLGLAFVVGTGRPPRPLSATPVLFLSAYLTCTVLGGWAAGSLVASTVIAVRVTILALAVLLLVRHFEAPRLVSTMIAALGVYGFLGAATGATTLAAGRLAGAVPRLHPNELASIAALVILWCAWRVLDGRDRPALLVVLGVSGAVLVATGSRTPLLALGVSSVVLLVYARALRMRTIMLALVVIPLALWLVAGTDVIQQLLLRNQDASELGTLSNRTIAWTAALGPKDSPWMEWLGGGLAMKQVEVPGQWWNHQILDSSWISAIVQGGWIGLAVCLIWVLYSLVRAFDSPLPFRAIQQAIVVYLAVRGVLESGLFDATTAFLMFFLTVMATPVRRSLVLAKVTPYQ